MQIFSTLLNFLACVSLCQALPSLLVETPCSFVRLCSTVGVAFREGGMALYPSLLPFPSFIFSSSVVFIFQFGCSSFCSVYSPMLVPAFNALVHCLIRPPSSLSPLVDPLSNAHVLVHGSHSLAHGYYTLAITIPLPASVSPTAAAAVLRPFYYFYVFFFVFMLLC